jgi:hypothetical protein
MMSKSAKLAHALLLRDAALTVIRNTGVWKTLAVRGAGDMKFLSARVGSLDILYRTPFQRMPQPDDVLKYRAAQFGLTVPKNLSYGLDVWAPKKVLNVEWDDNGNVALVSLRRGTWELEVIKLAKNEAT